MVPGWYQTSAGPVPGREYASRFSRYCECLYSARPLGNRFGKLPFAFVHNPVGDGKLSVSQARTAVSGFWAPWRVGGRIPEKRCASVVAEELRQRHCND